MFCSRCGKKVLEYMMFCPFCGTELVVPEQDAGAERAEAIPSDADTEAKEAVNLEKFTFDLPGEAAGGKAETSGTTDPEPLPQFEAGFGPFSALNWEEGNDGFMDDLDDPGTGEPAEASGQQTSYYRKRNGNPGRGQIDAATEATPNRSTARNDGSARRDLQSSEAASRRHADTFVPEKPLRSEDIFMDDVADAEDDYDAYDEYERREEARRRSRARDRYEDDDDDDYDDDRDGQGFLARHVRGIVGIVLFLALAVLLVFYFISDSGQTSLARINATLPLRAEIYAKLGKESYDAEDYQRAGVYYERALAREPGNYNWASSAVMAYSTGGNTDKAVDMLKKCIEINPNAVEPYYYLMNLFPYANSRPAEVERLIQQGYERTGDGRLKLG